MPVLESLNEVVQSVLATAHQGVYVEDNIDMMADVLETMFKFIDATGVDMRNTILDRIALMNRKNETELSEAAT